MFVRRLSATAIQDKKGSGLEERSLFRIDHSARGKFPIRRHSLCALVVRAHECLTPSRNKTVTSTAEPDELCNYVGSHEV